MRIVRRASAMNDGSSTVASLPPPGARAEVLEARGIPVRFGGLTALDAVSLAAAPCQVTGIIGPNGAGKTTLLNVLCGFVRPDSGDVRLGGTALTGLPPHRLGSLGVARTLPGAGRFRRAAGPEEVGGGAARHAPGGVWAARRGVARADGDERALRQRSLAALDRMGIAAHAGQLPDQLAYGLRKRVALARALVAGPRVLLLDEPASGLSEAELPELGDLITQLAD